jgi:hypothetical protein
MGKRKLASFAFFSLASISSWGITQDGSIGATSTGYIDAPFQISRYIRISGLQDISLNLSPLQSQPVLSSDPVTVCLYSSTGRASVIADTNTTVDRTSYKATLESPDATTQFSVTLDNVDLFMAAPQAFDSSVSTTDCGDNQGKHSLVVTLSQMPVRAGTYTATVSLTVSASDI